jgi:PH (Pleckstrin Homology) domain-containing protein
MKREESSCQNEILRAGWLKTKVHRQQVQMSAAKALTDPSQSDLAWAGYHPRAMVPAIALAAITSLAVWTGRWYLDDLSDLAERIGTPVLFALFWGVWLAVTAVFLYRTVTYTYRLTNRALLIDFGFLAPLAPAVMLTEVTDVVTGGNWVSRLFGVGWIEVRTPERATRLRGVRKPELFAVVIRDAVAKAREVK